MTNRFSRREMLRSAAAMVGLAMVSCTPAAQPSPQGPTGPATSGGTAPQPSTPKRGGIVKALYQAEPPHLDPTLETSYATHGGPGAPFGQLIRYKAGPDYAFESRVLEADLAVSWEQPDPATYIFKIRPNVKWQNKPPVNGRLFTAEDARWSIEFYRDRSNKNVFAAAFSTVKSVEATDPSTLKIVLMEPQSFFLDAVIASHYTKMLAKEIFEKEGSFKTTMVGTGPFMLDRWERGVKMVFTRNPDYWEAGKPYIDGFEWAIQGDYATRIAVLRAGETDYGPESTGPQNEDVESVKKAQPTLIWNRQMRANFYWIYLNLTKKPFDDVRVRQAISLAVDRNEVVKTIFFGDGVISTTMPPALKDWVIPDSERDQVFGKRDVAKAKQLLAAAGYPNGFETEFLPRESSGQEFAMCEVLVSMLSDIGIKANMKIMPRPEWTAALNAKNYQMAEAIGQTSFEPDDWTYVLHHSKSPRNLTGFSDPKADALFERQRSQTNVAERKQTMLEIQRLLNEQLPIVPISYRFEQMPHFPYLKNFKTHWSYNMPYLRECWLDK